MQNVGMQNEDDGLDHGVIADLREIGCDSADDVIGVLLRMFFEEMPNRLAAIGNFSRTADFTELARAAHRMKGSSAVIGARRLAGICGALESIGERGAAPDAIEDLLIALDTEANRLRETLPRALGHSGAD